MSAADATQFKAYLKERRKTHWIVRLVTPEFTEYREREKEKTKELVFGFFPPDMLDGATVYAARPSDLIAASRRAEAEKSAGAA